MTTLTRRDFLRLSGLAGATLVLETLPGGLVRKALAAPDTATGTAFAPTEWLSIARDGRVTVTVARAEMGQGVRTSLPVLVAEELEVDPAAVDVVNAEAGPRYPEMRTSGSGSVMEAWMPLRRAGAAARLMLVSAAAAQWNVPAESCHAENGAVLHAASGRRLAYGALTAAAAQLPVPAKIPLKTAFARIGQPARRHDGKAIVRGEARYGLDVRVPGMRFATIERAPSFGATLVWSSMKSPRCASSSLPTVASSEIGSLEIRRIARIFSSGISIFRARSAGSGSCPVSCSTRRESRLILLMFSIMCTGMRIVCAWSAMARVIACRIHHVA